MRRTILAGAAFLAAVLATPFAAPLEADGLLGVRTQQYQLRDDARNRPVWIDVWSPVPAGASYRDARVRAIVAFDPAAGPGYDRESLAAVTVPVLVVGAAAFLDRARAAADLD